MKKYFVFLLCFLVYLPVMAQDVTGSWNGALNIRGMKLHIVFNVSRSGTGYVSTMDSPDQGAKGIPVEKTVFRNDTLRFELPALGIVYAGKMENDATVSGDFKQSGMTFSLTLVKSEGVVNKISRPQEPKPPYPYYSEDVKFKNAKDSVILAGTLTIPDKNGKYPVVILITGSGPQNRDEEIMGHKPFLVLADHLTRHGIAVLRYDDRGVGGSSGSMKNTTSADFVNDVLAAIDYLKTRKRSIKSV